MEDLHWKSLTVQMGKTTDTLGVSHLPLPLALLRHVQVFERFQFSSNYAEGGSPFQTAILPINQKNYEKTYLLAFVQTTGHTSPSC